MILWWFYIRYINRELQYRSVSELEHFIPLNCIQLYMEA